MKQSIAEVKKRQQAILDYLRDKETSRVQDISVLFNVSELTVRRDLELLERQGLVLRYHGGARINTASEIDGQEFCEKDSQNREQKKNIAQYVASLVKDDDTVFINAGTTTLEILKLIQHKKIIVLTNNAYAESVIGDCEMRLFLTGGEYNAFNRSYSGSMATELIEKMYSSVCILGVNGISSANGITTTYYPETLINEMFLAHSTGLKIVAVDSSKIGKNCGFVSAGLNDIDILVTDSGADEKELNWFRIKGIKVVIV